MIKTDCKFYEGSKPCSFHKQDGRLCDSCPDYSPVKLRILIVKLDALGDVLRTTSILPNLHEKYPGASITWITKRNALSILKSNPYVDRVFSIDSNYLEFILNEEFDVGICLDSDSLSSSILSLAKCKSRFGFTANKAGKPIPVNKEAEEWWLMGVNDKLKTGNRKTYQEIIHNICSLDYKKFPPVINRSVIKEDLLKRFLRDNKIDTAHKIIGINTGGGNRWEWKKWILQYYIELIKKINSDLPESHIILYGGPEEMEFNQKIMSATGNLVIDAGCGNSLEEFITLVSLCNLFITPDSLGFHIATGLEKNVLVLVGPTSPWELEVYGKGEIIYPDMDCIACYLNKCDKNPNCMMNIPPDLIMQKIHLYLQLPS